MSWQDRVFAEKQTLDERLHKLHTSLSEHPNTASDRQYELLQEQAYMMQRYSLILAQRLREQ